MTFRLKIAYAINLFGIIVTVSFVAAVGPGLLR